MRRPSTISPELRLILALSRSQLDETGRSAIKIQLSQKIDWQKIFSTSVNQGTAALLYHNIWASPFLKEIIPAGALSQFKDYYYATLHKNLNLWKEFLRIREIFNKQGLSLIPLKGIILGEILYHNPGLRPVISDIDILIKEAWLAEAADLLREVGFSPLGQGSSHEAAWRRDSLVVDLHWNFLPRGLNKIDTEKLWARAGISSFQGQEAAFLSWEDQLLTLSLQVRHDWPDLKLFRLCDINEILVQKRTSLDWKYLREAARQYHLQHTLYLALFFCSKILDSPLPRRESEMLKKKSLRNIIISGFIREYVNHLDRPGEIKGGFFRPGLLKTLTLDTFGDLAAILAQKNIINRLIVSRFFRQSGGQAGQRPK